MYSVYRIVNQVNRKCYVGFTVRTPEKRFLQHKKDARKLIKYPLYRAFGKYGVENFSMEVLQQGDDEEWGLKAVEPLWVGICRPEYNQTLGGDGMLGWVPSAETRAKMSRAKTGKKLSSETIAKMKARRPGVETRAKMSRSRIGLRPSAETVLKMSLDGRLGRKHTPEAIAKMRDGRKRHTPEAIAKMKAHVWTDEHRTNLVEAQRIRRAREKSLDSMG